MDLVLIERIFTLRTIRHRVYDFTGNSEGTSVGHEFVVSKVV